MVVEVVLPNSNCFRKARVVLSPRFCHPAVEFRSAKAPKLANLNSDLTVLTAGH